MSFYEEYNSFFKDLGPVGTAGYKFFDSFKISWEDKTISFHEDYEHTFTDETLLKEFRDFLRITRSVNLFTENVYLFTQIYIHLRNILLNLLNL